jgi:hypothetical protein
MDTVDFSQVIVTVISVLISGGLLTLIGDRLKGVTQKRTSTMKSRINLTSWKNLFQRRYRTLGTT